VDPDGEAAETVWDAANIAMGVASLVSNVKAGHTGAAALDAVGVIVDVAAAAVPFVPGGAGAIIKGVRAADKAADVVQAADKVADAARAVDRIDDGTKGADLFGEARKLEKAATGPGSVPPSQRDPRRVWTKSEKEDALDALGGRCEGCDSSITIDQAKGHHKTRHSDGGRTDDANRAILCPECHREIHRR
jgi:hypothetical protein